MHITADNVWRVLANVTNLVFPEPSGRNINAKYECKILTQLINAKYLRDILVQHISATY